MSRYIEKYIEGYSEYGSAISLDLPFKSRIGCGDVDYLYGPYRHGDGNPYYLVRNFSGPFGITTKYKNKGSGGWVTSRPSSELKGESGNYETDEEYAVALAIEVMEASQSNHNGRTVCVIDDDGNSVEYWYNGGSDSSCFARKSSEMVWDPWSI